MLGTSGIKQLCCCKIKSELSDNFPCVENFLVPITVLCVSCYIIKLFTSSLHGQNKGNGSRKFDCLTYLIGFIGTGYIDFP